MSELRESHEDDWNAWVKYSEGLLTTNKLNVEIVIEHFKRYVSQITAWQDKEYLIFHAADYIEKQTGFANLFIREVLVNIYDGENSL